MTPLARRASLRFFRRHPGQLLLGIIGIALGVAVIVSIHMTRESARAAFDLTARILTGRATHQVVAGPRGLDEALFARLRTGPGLHRSAPVIDVRVTLPDHEDRRVRLLGVDPIAEATLRPGWGAGIADSDTDAAAGNAGVTALMTEPGTALVSAATAARYRISAGDPLTLRHGGRDVMLTVAAVIDGGDTPWLADDVLLTDIATAQETLAARGRLTRIDVL
ncbi:MAG: ABC transporter permease, partial [Gammaproteobacteria bacterium]|nr:ABC transporter permease [Gammaproteobacteria bacterium]